MTTLKILTEILDWNKGLSVIQFTLFFSTSVILLAPLCLAYLLKLNNQRHLYYYNFFLKIKQWTFLSKVCKNIKYLWGILGSIMWSHLYSTICFHTDTWYLPCPHNLTHKVQGASKTTFCSEYYFACWLFKWFTEPQTLKATHCLLQYAFRLITNLSELCLDMIAI